MALLIVLGSLLVLGQAGCGLPQKVSDAWFDLMDSRDTNLRKRVVVAPFVSRFPHLRARAQAVGLAVAQRLEKQGGIVLVDFKLLQDALTKVDPGIKNNEERIVAAAKTLGLNTVLSGALTNLALQYDKTGIYGFRENEPFALLELNLRLIDVATGVLLAEGVQDSKLKLSDLVATNITLGQPYPADVLNKLQADLVPPTVKWVGRNVAAQAWTGFVLALQGGQVKVTVGRDTGLSVGDLLVVYGRGTQIRSGSGRILFLPGAPVGRLKLVKLDARSSWAVPMAEAGGKKPGPFEPGQTLRTH
ncbi:MAG: hypothetical protein C4525_04690 [Desulfarculus sp.]|jgi:hypothetical protein|nr:MAG: hypothetical protein C4525_04690 [Desulfarculus sp.]